MGWSKEALIAGAEQVGYPGITHGMFSGGGADLVLHFQKTSNQKLVDLIKQYQTEDPEKPLPPVLFVEKACQDRLKMVIPYISRWPQALAIMALPPNVPNALAAVLTLSDDICYHAGDRSVNFDWYARRLAVAGVYKASELYLIQDSSPEYKETWKFLNRRLNEAVQLQHLVEGSDGVSKGAKETITAAFTTARNILGMNRIG